MQFNSYTYNEMARESYNGHGEFKEAGDAEFQYLPSTATTLVVVTTYADCRDHVIATATLSDDKINLLLNAQSNDDEALMPPPTPPAGRGMTVQTVRRERKGPR